MKKKYNSKYSWMRDGAEIVFAYIGTFVHAEGLADLVEAMKIVVKQLPKSRLVLIGGGPEASQLREQVARLKLTNNVLIHDWIPYSETYAAQNQADILLCPIRTPIEGSIISSIIFPVKIPNYLTASKPIITSRVGDIPLAVRHEKEGILLDFPTPQNLAKSLIHLANNANLREEYGRNCSLRAKLFTWNRAIEKLLQVYEEILK